MWTNDSEAEGQHGIFFNAPCYQHEVLKTRKETIEAHCDDLCTLWQSSLWSYFLSRLTLTQTYCVFKYHYDIDWPVQELFLSVDNILPQTEDMIYSDRHVNLENCCQLE